MHITTDTMTLADAMSALSALAPGEAVLSTPRRSWARRLNSGAILAWDSQTGNSAALTADGQLADQDGPALREIEDECDSEGEPRQLRTGTDAEQVAIAWLLS